MTPRPTKGAIVGIDDVRAAADRIAGQVLRTPAPLSEALSDLTGSRVYCKLDYLQRTGSFKERGACNALMLLKDQGTRGAIAASAGNHALALAYHGQRLGVPVTVVMPKFAPIIKAHTCRQLGAEVVLHGDSFQDAREHADALKAERGLTYVHGYDDPAVIAGAGTAAIELLDDVPGLDAVIVPVGGGGLLAGVCVAIKSIRPEVQVISVESKTMPGWQAALDAGEPVRVEASPTLADGLAVGRVGANAFAIASKLADRHIVVSEETIALSILRLIEREKAVVEGAAASSLAALLSAQVPELRGRQVALMLCGGNIDPLLLCQVIEKGLAADGRLVQFRATISDRPGGLARLTNEIAEAGGTILDVEHDRAFSGFNAFTVDVTCRVGTRDAAHARELMQKLGCFKARALPARE